MRHTVLVFISTIILFSSSASLHAQKKGSPDATYSSGIGIHLGDPFAVTYKKNLGRNAIEFNLGMTPYFGGYDIGNYFDNNTVYHGKGYHYNGGSYSTGLAFQFHYLFHYALPMEGLRWYWGLGPQIRMRGYSVNYYDQYGNYVPESGVDFGIGLDGVVGAEYKFKKVPFAVYADIVPYMQFATRFWVYPTGGIGARYTF